MPLQNKWQMNTSNSRVKIAGVVPFCFPFIIILMFCTDNKKGKQFSDTADLYALKHVRNLKACYNRTT